MPGKILAIAAHPGDALFTMGATVAQQIRRGASGAFLSLSLGERGAPKTIPVKRYGELQRAATGNAARLLGAEALFLNYPDAEISANEETSLAVCDIVREQRPEIVLTHWRGSWHKDHQNCYLIVLDAVFYAGLDTLSRKQPPHTVSKIYFAENWEDVSGFQPDIYIDIEPVYTKWMEACDLYPMWRGQTGFFRYNDCYSSLAVMRGCLSNFRYAVALMADPSRRMERVEAL